MSRRLKRTATARRIGPRLALLAVAIGALQACGETPATLGIRVNAIGLQKTDVGPSPSDLPARRFSVSSPTHNAVSGNLLESDGRETLVALENGAGVAVTDARGHTFARITTAEHLTHFGVIEASRAPLDDLVLYGYPNAGRGGTFRVMTPDEVVVAMWTERPPPSHFDVASWEGTPAVYYLQGDELVVRGPTGDLLARLPAPSGVAFQDVHVANAASGRLVLVASGNGYTPFHMVCVYAPDRQLVFHEIAREHAFGLDVRLDRLAFTVLARSRQWSYQAREPFSRLRLHD